MLQKVVHGFSSVFVVIDALDEYSEGNGTREVLLREIQALQPNLHLLVTSRWVPTIQRQFQEIDGSLQLEILASEEDIRDYLKMRISRETRLQGHVREDQELQKSILDTIVESCQGMYVYTLGHDTSPSYTQSSTGFYLRSFTLTHWLKSRTEEQSVEPLRACRQN